MHTFFFSNGTCEVLTNTISLRGLGCFLWHVCGIWWELVWCCDEVLLWWNPLDSLWAWGWPPPYSAWWRLSWSLCMMERGSLAVPEWRAVTVTCFAGPLFFEGLPPSPLTVTLPAVLLPLLLLPSRHSAVAAALFARRFCSSWGQH